MQIFPKEFLEHSKEYYLKKISIRSQIIYLAFLLVVLFALIALPVIKVDTFTQVRGDKIMKICDLKEGKKVGQIKFAIEDAILDGKIENTYEAALEYLYKIKDNFPYIN